MQGSQAGNKRSGLGKRVKVLISREVEKLEAERNKLRKRAHITITGIEYQVLDRTGKRGYMCVPGHYHKLTTLISCVYLLEGNRWLKMYCKNRYNKLKVKHRFQQKLIKKFQIAFNKESCKGSHFERRL